MSEQQNLLLQNFKKMFHPSYIILRIQKLEVNSVDLDEVAHYEPPHQDLGCLQIQLFSSLVLKVLKETFLKMVTLVTLIT